MEEQELLGALGSWVELVAERGARARARILNDASGPGDPFGFISYPLISIAELEALRVKAFAALVEVNRFHDAIIDVIETKKDEGES